MVVGNCSWIEQSVSQEEHGPEEKFTPAIVDNGVAPVGLKSFAIIDCMDLYTYVVNIRENAF